jgi:cytochrome P450
MSEASPRAATHELFNRGIGMGSVRDPYPELRALREKGPVHRIDLRASFPLFCPQNENPLAFLVVSAELVTRVLTDPETFCSSGYAETFGLAAGENILQMDFEQHARHRRLVQYGFTRKALDRWKESVVEPIVAQHIDAFAARGRADLVGEFAFPFPIHVIAELFGLPDDDMPSFHDWASGIMLVAIDYERGIESTRKLTEYLRPFIAERRRRPGDDLLSLLVEARDAGELLSDQEILAFLLVMIPAGGETTYRSTANLLFALLSNPEQLEAVRSRPALIPQAVEEGLRWEPPITAIMRVARRDIRLGGVDIPGGARVITSLGSASRDEERHPDGERFDVLREPRPSLAFGFGPHRCLGMHLGRMENEAALGALLQRLPRLRLDPDAADVHITGAGFRAPERLPVLFDPEVRRG